MTLQLPTKNVVIVGGGFAGATVAQVLERHPAVNVTLIDTKDFFEYTPSVLRTCVAPNHQKDIKVLHTKYLKKVSSRRKFLTTQTFFEQGEVTQVSPSAVLVTSPKKLEGSADGVYINLAKHAVPYDYLVLAGGSNYHVPEGLATADPKILFRADTSQSVVDSNHR